MLSYYSLENTQWGKPFECNHCDNSFADQSALVYHLRTYCGEKPLNCDQCDKYFTQEVGF